MTNSFAAVIPVYNGERYLRRAVESVLSQTHPLDEVVVVDDGSTDGTPDLLKSFGSRVRVVRQANRGVAAARNTGIRLTTATWVALLDADDFWHPKKIEVFENAIRGSDDASFFYSDSCQVDKDGAVQRLLRLSKMKRATVDSLLLRDCFVTSSVVVRREAAIAVGLFREDFSCPAGVEDWDFLIRLSRSQPGKAVSGCWTYYRHHASSAIQSQRDRLLQDALRVLDLNHDATSPEILSRARAIVYYESAVRHLASMSFNAAREDLERSWEGALPLTLRALALWMVSWGGKPLIQFLLWFRKRLLTFPAAMGQNNCSIDWGNIHGTSDRKNESFKRG